MLHRLFGFVVFVVLLGQGLILFFLALSSEGWAHFTALLTERRSSGACAGIALACLALLLALTGIRKKKRAKFWYYDSEKGRVSISTDAIAEYVAKLASEFPSVMKMRPVVIPTKSLSSSRRSPSYQMGHERCNKKRRRLARQCN